MTDTPLRLVIFDVDGTLVDSQAHILAAMAATFQGVGLAIPAREQVLGIIGLSLPQAFAALVPGATGAQIATLVERYRQSSHALTRERDETVFYPGALEAIAELDRAGFVISAATGKSRRGLERMLDKHDLRRVIIGGQTADDAPSKPHPQMVLNCLAATGVEAPHAVMVGDTSFDMQMGRAAGCHAVGVSWGYHPRPRLQEAGAHHIIDRFEDLIGVVEARLAPPGVGHAVGNGVGP